MGRNVGRIPNRASAELACIENHLSLSYDVNMEEAEPTNNGGSANEAVTEEPSGWSAPPISLAPPSTTGKPAEMPVHHSTAPRR